MKHDSTLRCSNQLYSNDVFHKLCPTSQIFFEDALLSIKYEEEVLYQKQQYRNSSLKFCNHYFF